jgi:hypothetical protein
MLASLGRLFGMMIFSRHDGDYRALEDIERRADMMMMMGN